MTPNGHPINKLKIDVEAAIQTLLHKRLRDRVSNSLKKVLISSKAKKLGINGTHAHIKLIAIRVKIQRGFVFTTLQSVFERVRLHCQVSQLWFPSQPLKHQSPHKVLACFLE